MIEIITVICLSSVVPEPIIISKTFPIDKNEQRCEKVWQAIHSDTILKKVCNKDLQVTCEIKEQ